MTRPVGETSLTDNNHRTTGWFNEMQYNRNKLTTYSPCSGENTANTELYLA